MVSGLEFNVPARHVWSMELILQNDDHMLSIALINLIHIYVHISRTGCGVIRPAVGWGRMSAVAGEA